MTLGELLKVKRGERPITVISQAIGVGRETYSNWENGKTLPRRANRLKIAKYYQISIETLEDYAEEAHDARSKGYRKKDFPELWDLMLYFLDCGEHEKAQLLGQIFWKGALPNG